MEIGIIVGVVVFVVAASAIGEGLIQDPVCGIFPATALGIWAAWLFFHYNKVSDNKLLHPIPKKYLATSARAFSVVHNILSEGTYNYGKRWRIVLADWRTGRILAELSHFDDGSKMNGTPEEVLSYLVSEKMELAPQAKLEAQIIETEDRKTIVRVDFAAAQSKAAIHNCQSIVHSVTSAIEAQLGPGLTLSEGMSTRLPGPPWWLLVLTIACLIYLIDSVVRALSP